MNRLLRTESVYANAATGGSVAEVADPKGQVPVRDLLKVSSGNFPVADRTTQNPYGRYTACLVFSAKAPEGIGLLRNDNRQATMAERAPAPQPQ